ncbi:hypothetical protein DIPPA_07523 [Diplonema papillatum]|nr:hypothetical protein DIPPA_07523 [Diplonema papillatum]
MGYGQPRGKQRSAMTVDQTDTAPTAPPMEAAVQGKHGLRVLFAAFGGADVTAAVDEAVASSGDGSLFVPAWQYTRLSQFCGDHEYYPHQSRR